jgi:indolepyruvate ferredoxin oxidoreductase alpha subunit
LGYVKKVSAFDLPAAAAAVKEAVNLKGVRAIIFEGGCVAVEKVKRGNAYTVDNEICTGCGICAARLGCPALTMRGDKAYIDEALCFPCLLCSSVCPVKAIKEVIL